MLAGFGGVPMATSKELAIAGQALSRLSVPLFGWLPRICKPPQHSLSTSHPATPQYSIISAATLSPARCHTNYSQQSFQPKSTLLHRHNGRWKY
ncbi:hypothetical protein J6590_085762 [Homalodisca vitripennis]|nr:hypothetical protein J6590_085762 [Homalodisca vitripennis]